MRNVKTIRFLATAAVAAMPTLGFAFDEGVAGKSRPVPIDPLTQMRHPDLFQMGQLSGGGYSLIHGGGLVGGPDADGSFTWIGPNNGTWQNPAHWTPAGGPPDGANAHAFITPLNGGGNVALGGNITLNTLNFSDPQIASISGALPPSPTPPRITFTGAATINTTEFAKEFFPATPKFFGTAIGVPELATMPPTPARPVEIGGTAGLTVSGGPVSFRFANVYSGDTRITNNGELTLLTADPNQSLGTSGNVVLDNGQLWNGVDFSTLNRNIVVNAGGGRLVVGAGVTTQNYTGVVSGAGSFSVNNVFGGTGVFTANNTITGAVRFEGLGTNTLQGNGAFASVANVHNGGTIQMQRDGGAPNVNRLPDAGTVNMYGGALRMMNFDGGSAMTETVGTTHLRTGTPAIVVRPGGGAVYNGGTLIRSPGTGLEVQGQGLGSAPGNNVTNVNFTNAAGFVVNGIIPFAYGHGQDILFVGVESNFTELLTAGPNGLVPRSQAGGYLENTFAGSTATTNVRLQSNTLDQSFNAAAGTNVNSLVLAPGFDGGGNGVNGITVNGGPINITSGALLSSTSGFTPGGEINAGVGNIINAAINFGSTEGIIAAPGAITTFGAISGSGGVSKIGVRTWFNNSTTSTYTGETVLSGFNRHTGNLLLGQPSAYGMDASPIVLVPFDRQQDDPGLGTTGIPFVSFGPDAGAGETTMTRGLHVKAGGNGILIGTLIRNFSFAPFNMNGPIILDEGADIAFQALSGGFDTYRVGGNISGPGHVTTVVSVGGLSLTLSGNNTFSGGFDWAGGDIIANSNTAFGTGLVTVTGNVAHNLSSTTGPRTLANDFLLDNGTFTITGGQPFTFTGDIFLDVIAGSLLELPSGNVATFAGAMQQGALFKEGLGTLNLSGNSTFHGQLNVGNGPIPGGMVVLRSNNAVGSNVGVTAANHGDNTVALAGGITVGDNEAMVMRGEGIGGLGNLRNLSGNNTWNGSVFVQEQTGLTTKGAIGVDNAAETLTITGSIFTLGTNTAGDPAGNLGVRKVGAGTMVVGRSTFTSGTSTFQGSVLSTGSFEISQGTVRLANVSTGGPGTPNVPSVADVAAISIAGGPASPTARLDMGRNAMVVDYADGGPNPLADIQSLINAGRAGGAWTGNGITSSDLIGVDPARADLFAFHTPANLQPGTTFLGNPVDTSAVLVFPALRGDANLDWRVNLSDFNILAANFGQMGRIWTGGDFNGDGIVNLTDFNILAGNFGITAGPDGPTPDDWSALRAAVPEPSSLGLLTVAGLGLLRRKRRLAR